VTAHLRRLSDRLGPGEPPYRSRGEAQLGRLLDRYGIPFFYEQPRLIYDRGLYRVWRPDFTLPQQQGMVLEYAGMADIPDYAAGIRHKRRAYASNGIPAVFIYPKDISRPGWPERIIRQLYRTAGSRYRSYRGAQARSGPYR